MLQTNLPQDDRLKRIHSASSCGRSEVLPPPCALRPPPRKHTAPKDSAEQRHGRWLAAAEQLDTVCTKETNAHKSTPASSPVGASLQKKNQAYPESLVLHDKLIPVQTL